MTNEQQPPRFSPGQGPRVPTWEEFFTEARSDSYFSRVAILVEFGFSREDALLIVAMEVVREGCLRDLRVGPRKSNKGGRS